MKNVSLESMLLELRENPDVYLVMMDMKLTIVLELRVVLHAMQARIYK